MDVSAVSRAALLALVFVALSVSAQPSRSNLSQQNSSASFGTGAWNPSGVATTNGRLEWVLIESVEETDSGLLATDLTISGGATWTFCGSGNQAGTDWSYGGRFAYATGDGSSWSVTIDAGSHNVHIYRLEWYEYNGANNAAPCGATGNAAPDTDGDGAYSLTLSGAPASSSEVMGVALGTGAVGGTFTTTEGSGFTELFDAAPDSGFMVTETEVRTGSTSTTVDWVDLSAGGTGTPDERVGFAAEVKAAGSGPSGAQKRLMREDQWSSKPGGR